MKHQNTAQKKKFSIMYFFSKCDQIHSFLRIWSHLLKKSLMENFIFCAVKIKHPASDFNCDTCRAYRYVLAYYCVLRKYSFQCIIAALEKLLRKLNITLIFLEFPREIVLPLNCVKVFPFSQLYTAWKVSVYGVFLVRIFPHSDWIRRDTEYSVGMRENTDQENSE